MFNNFKQMAFVKIATIFILFYIKIKMTSPQEEFETITATFRLLYKTSTDRSQTDTANSSTVALRIITGLLTIDLGVLHFVEYVAFSMTPGSESSHGISVVTQYHRMTRSRGNLCAELRSFDSKLTFSCRSLCRKIRVSGISSFIRVSITGYNTYHDDNLGCYINDYSLISGSSTSRTIEDCTDSCSTGDYEAAFFNEETTLGCQCVKDISSMPKVSNRFCTTTCSRNIYQICGGERYFTAYSIRAERKTNYEDFGVWQCIFDSSSCSECSPDANVCNMEDRDECLSLDICGPHFVCINLPGTFICNCSGGLTMDLLHYTCIDFDECSEDRNICVNGNCLNTYGSYSCNCFNGFQNNGPLCVDIDECRTDANTLCGRGTCVNIRGGFECDCERGFLSGDGGCVDIDECEEEVCPGVICENIPGSFECSCIDGFVYKEMRCIDIDECVIMCKMDNFICHNTPGSYECVCQRGYEIHLSVCKDIDECRSEDNQCGDYSCFNNDGSFMCQCPVGMRQTNDLIGDICEDLDECSRENECEEEISICINTPGSYMCYCLGVYQNIDAMNCAEILFVSEENEYEPDTTPDDNQSKRSKIELSTIINIVILLCLVSLSLAIVYRCRGKMREHQGSVRSVNTSAP